MIRPVDISSTAISLVLAMVSLSAIAAASCAGIGESCEFDSDCSGGNLCIEKTCYSACSDQQDCQPPYEMCQAHTRQTSAGEETVKACVSEDFGGQNNGNNNCADTGDCCTDDAQCVEHFQDDDAVCGIDGRCIIPVSPPAQAVLIRDRSQIDTAEDPPDGGLGADIAAVYVRASGSDEPVGFGVALEYAPANSARGDSAIFDGTAPSLDDSGQCVDTAFQESTASLGGQGGYLLVAFEDTDGTRFQLNTSLEIVVVEWGANCGQSEGADVYDVYFCSMEPLSSSNESAGIDPDAHCERQLNTQAASGYQVLGIGNGG
jgi:hypothetical protein